MFIAAAGAVALSFAVIERVLAKRRRNPRGLPLPPGPKGLPFLGNLSGLPEDVPWEGYHELCKKYGASFRSKFPKDSTLTAMYMGP